ncbi:helix-turn-helix domain-containing protein [Avibacterium sp. 20-15]|uniref:LexA family transcriptional regulator n=1 Tax=unclassified Avibacterium TaxID=2685287 RepID=UPI0020267BB5|nr:MULTISPECIES: XRE family transcriptional regulator [unclassified Avibacterium]MCW9733720.1 helix-turn-helix domain-containing protein [Avibacterium sp. 20-15]URL03569.1 helix-turn-helix domain-containing protein [Avibacterium sp. 20-132]
MTEATLSSRLKALMDKKNVSIQDLSNAIGVTYEMARRYTLGTAEPRINKLEIIAEYLGTSPAWLQFGVNDSAIKGSTLNGDELKELKPKSELIKRAPIRGYAQLGREGYWEDMSYPVGIGDGYINWMSYDPDVYALKCQGTSMQPRIKHGEYAILEPNHRVINGDEVLIVTADQQVMVKVYAYERDGLVRLESINEDFAPIDILRSDIEKMHYLAGIAKSSLVFDY